MKNDITTDVRVGRPRKYSVSKRYLVTLDATLVARFDTLIQSVGMNRSDTINKMIDEYVTTEECKQSTG